MKKVKNSGQKLHISGFHSNFCNVISFDAPLLKKFQRQFDLSPILLIKWL